MSLRLVPAALTAGLLMAPWTASAWTEQNRAADAAVSTTDGPGNLDPSISACLAWAKAFDASTERRLGSPLKIVYQRTRLGDPRERTRHVLYTWPAGRARLEVQVLEPGGQNVVSLLTPRRAWVLAEGRILDVDPRRLSALISAHSLDRLLQPLIDLADHLSTGEDPLSRAADPNLQASQTALRVQLKGGAVATMTLDPATGTPLELTLRGGDVLESFEYSAYRIALPGQRIPFEIAYRRGEILKEIVHLERVEVQGGGWQELLNPEPGEKGGTKKQENKY